MIIVNRLAARQVVPADMMHSRRRWRAELEREIGGLVYKLHDLTPEETAVVEDGTREK